MVALSVKTTAGKTYEIDVDLQGTVLACKEVLVGPTQVPVPQQRLIFKGKVLQDAQTLASYGAACVIVDPNAMRGD